MEIESASDLIETFGSGPWEHFVLVPCGNYHIPAVTLELRLITELYRDRPDRYNPLVEHLRAHDCDADLVRRGMQFIGLHQQTQMDLLQHLSKM